MDPNMVLTFIWNVMVFTLSIYKTAAKLEMNDA
jgi:hypothetical protein